MKSSSVPADVFGYLVCLLATVIFFMSVAGIVNNAFRVAHPTMRPAMMARGQMGRHFRGGFSALNPPAPMGSPETNFGSMRDRFVADARFDAIRRLVLSLVMLVVAIAVFRRTFGWLNPRGMPA